MTKSDGLLAHCSFNRRSLQTPRTAVMWCRAPQPRKTRPTARGSRAMPIQQRADVFAPAFVNAGCRRVGSR